MELIEVILSKENLNRAYKKVVANKGASGVDGVTVEELGDYIRTVSYTHLAFFLFAVHNYSIIIFATKIFYSISWSSPVSYTHLQPVMHSTHSDLAH